jgi:hypothetical protein
MSRGSRNRRGGAGGRVERGGLVLVFGENRNDSRSIASLAVAANAGLERRVKAVPRPASLTRGAEPLPVRRWIDELCRMVRAFEESQGPVTAVLVHRDADRSDPDACVEKQLREQIRRVPKAEPVVPVQELEAWWFLFPDAVEAVNPRAWRQLLPRGTGGVETIGNPKEQLIGYTRRQRGGPVYCEVDSVSIAEQILRNGFTPAGVSSSYDRFVELVSLIV